MTIGILDIASHVPEGRRDVPRMSKDLNVPEDFLKEKLGTECLPLCAPAEDATSLGAEAVSRLLERNPDIADSVSLLIVVTQNPAHEGLPHTAALIHGQLELDRGMAAFDVSLGCSGFVYGMVLATRFLAGQPKGKQHGILVTADPYSKVVDPQDRDTAMLFGDAATATLIGPDGVLVPGESDLVTDGRHADAICVNDGVLSMKGRKVFNFVMSNVPGQINRTLESQGLDIEEVDRFFLHQGSRYIVECLAQRLGVSIDRVPVGIQSHGNTVSSSIPLLLEEYWSDLSGRPILLAGFGVGLSSGVMVMTTAQKEEGQA